MIRSSESSDIVRRLLQREAGSMPAMFLEKCTNSDKLNRDAERSMEYLDHRDPLLPVYTVDWLLKGLWSFGAVSLREERHEVMICNFSRQQSSRDKKNTCPASADNSRNLESMPVGWSFDKQTSLNYQKTSLRSLLLVQ
jgi:hypothetical protein